MMQKEGKELAEEGNLIEICSTICLGDRSVAGATSLAARGWEIDGERSWAGVVCSGDLKLGCKNVVACWWCAVVTNCVGQNMVGKRH